jgi:hypothetical protein
MLADQLDYVSSACFGLTPPVRLVTVSDMCSRSACLRENAVLGSASGTGVSRTRQMAQKPVNAKVAERCGPLGELLELGPQMHPYLT